MYEQHTGTRPILLILPFIQLFVLSMKMFFLGCVLSSFCSFGMLEEQVTKHFEIPKSTNLGRNTLQEGSNVCRSLKACLATSSRFCGILKTHLLPQFISGKTEDVWILDFLEIPAMSLGLYKTQTKASLAPRSLLLFCQLPRVPGGLMN